jgi:hypothetical protein
MKRRSFIAMLGGAGGVLSGNFLVAELAANGKHRGQPLNRRGLSLRRTCRHDGNERCDHAGIERIVLCQDSTRIGELPQPERIDLPHRHAGREQGTHDASFVAARRFDADRSDRVAPRLLDHFAPADWIITDRQALLVGQHHEIETILGHIDSAKREHGHLRIPSLLMRARARATVRVWKKRLELQAHSRFEIRGGCGLPVATGAVS